MWVTQPEDDTGGTLSLGLVCCSSFSIRFITSEEKDTTVTYRYSITIHEPLALI